jgi:hypothetical protein
LKIQERIARAIEARAIEHERQAEAMGVVQYAVPVILGMQESARVAREFHDDPTAVTPTPPAFAVGDAVTVATSGDPDPSVWYVCEIDEHGTYWLAGAFRAGDGWWGVEPGRLRAAEMAGQTTENRK